VEKRPKPRKLRIRIDKNASPPVAVSVPAVDISAPVIPLHRKPTGKLEVPRDFSEAGWRLGGPEPGERGAAMMTAHVDSRSGPAAFYTLAKVKAGADIKVKRKDGTTVTFVAGRSERVPKDSFPTKRVYGKTRLPTLRLVTCGGPFNDSTGHYRDNIVVYATRKPS
jgi:sortase (surface protein transpeptidase)